MSPRFALSLGGVLLLLLLGCTSRGPRFDPRLKSPEAHEGEQRESHYPDAIRLDQQFFNVVELTNQIQPEWLNAPTNFFKLGPGDVLDIEALGEANSRATTFLGPDGKLYYSLLPGISAWGLTLFETKDLLEKELARYNRVKPELILTLRGAASVRVWILGGVQSPGIYPLATPMTLLEAIATAGGTTVIPGSTEEAVDFNRSFIMRQGRLLKVDFYGLLRRGDLSQNIYLQPDDFTYLRPGTARSIYVLGALAAPNVMPYSDQVSLVSALTLAGPPLRFAYLSHVAIIRGSLTHPSIAIVDYTQITKGKAVDIKLEPGDIVYVPFAPYRELALLAENILIQFVQTIAVNEGIRAVLPNAAPVGPSIGVGGTTTK
jgi:polysaccharide export outer membrane protein